MLRQVTHPAAENVETIYEDLAEAVTKALELYEEPAFKTLQARVEFLETLLGSLDTSLNFGSFVQDGCNAIRQDGESTAAKMYRAVDREIASAIQSRSNPPQYNGINSTVGNTDQRNAKTNLNRCADGMAPLFKQFGKEAVNTQIYTETSSAQIIDQIQQELVHIITLTDSLESLPAATIGGQLLKNHCISDNFKTPFHGALEVKKCLTGLRASISLAQGLETRDTSPQDLKGEDNTRSGPEGIADYFLEAILSSTEPQGTDTAPQAPENEDKTPPIPADPAAPLNQDRPEGEFPEAADDVILQTQEPDLEPHASHAETPTPDESGSPSESNEALERLDTSEEDTINKQCELVGLNRKTVDAIITAANQEVTRQSVLKFVGAFGRIKNQLEDADLPSENAKEQALHLIKFGWTHDVVNKICQLAPKIVRKSRALGRHVDYSDFGNSEDLEAWNKMLGEQLKEENDFIRSFLENTLNLSENGVETVIKSLTQKDDPIPLSQIGERIRHLQNISLAKADQQQVTISTLAFSTEATLIRKCMCTLLEYSLSDYESFNRKRQLFLERVRDPLYSMDFQHPSLLFQALTGDTSALNDIGTMVKAHTHQNSLDENALPDTTDQQSRVRMVLKGLYNIPDEFLDDAARVVVRLANSSNVGTYSGITWQIFHNRGDRAGEIREQLQNNRLIEIKHERGEVWRLTDHSLIKAAGNISVTSETLATALEAELSKIRESA